jgi:hypothetical protein
MTITDTEDDDTDQQPGDDTVTSPDAADPAVVPPPADEAPVDPASDDSDPETFPRAYVQQLRKESAGYRERAQQADQLAERLHTELARATGRLADPTDLPFDQAHLDDPDALAAAVDDLLDRKPHLKARRPVGDVGQGDRGRASEPVNLAAMLRDRA